MRYLMAIQKIHELPGELPHARLFLDDIEEISKILLNAYTASLAETRKEAKITYTIGDLRMDSIDDLQTLGGSTTDFRITVGEHGSAEVGFRGFFLNPSIALYSLDEQERWAVYAKIKSIFDRRQLGIKNAITVLPTWLKGSLWALLGALIPSVCGWLVPTRFGFWPAIGYAVLTLLGFVVLLRPSRVFLVRSHESSNLSSAAMKGYVRDFILIIIGALVAELVRYIFRK